MDKRRHLIENSSCKPKKFKRIAMHGQNRSELRCSDPALRSYNQLPVHLNSPWGPDPCSMELKRKSNADRVRGLAYAAFVLIGIYASLRYGAEWANALGKFVGAA